MEGQGLVKDKLEEGYKLVIPPVSCTILITKLIYFSY